MTKSEIAALQNKPDEYTKFVKPTWNTSNLNRFLDIV